jgi:hypothetical protein
MAVTTPVYVLPMEDTFWKSETGSGWNALMAPLNYHYAEESEACAEAIRSVRDQKSGANSRILDGKSRRLLLEVWPDDDQSQPWHWRLSEAPATD